MRRRIKRSYRVAKYVIYRQTIIDPIDHFWTFIGAFTGISIIGLMQGSNFDKYDSVFLIGSFGASAVLVFGSVNSPLAQPRNLIGGHLVCAIVGVTICKLLPHQLWLSASLAVSISIVLMQVTKTMHPPGGATALIANIGSEQIKSLGFHYVLFPVLSGVLVLYLVAMLVNNLPRNRHYPSRG